MLLDPPIPKTPFEEYDVEIDFENRKTPGGETLTIVSYDCVDRTGADAKALLIKTSPAPAVAGTRVVFWVQGGVHAMDYVVTFHVQFATTPPTKWDGSVTISVRQVH